MKFLLIVLVTLFAPDNISGLLHRCPREKHFHELRLKQNIKFFSFCTCEKNDSIYVNCQDLKNEELSTVLNFLQGYIIDQVTIKRSEFHHLSEGIFNRLRIHKLIFEDVRFEYVYLFSALKGLEFYLEELQFIKCKVSNWIWKRGKHFIFLEKLIFSKTNLPNDMTNVFKIFPTKLRTLKINSCYIHELGNEALKKMSHLEQIELEGNYLNKVSRSMFPNPARRLKHLSLIDNPITELPENMFQNMDRLEFLLLSGIKVSSLKNDTFYPVWNQLQEIYLNIITWMARFCFPRNPRFLHNIFSHITNIRIDCDCSIAWLLAETEASILRKPFCSLYNKELEDIKSHFYKMCSFTNH